MPGPGHAGLRQGRVRHSYESLAERHTRPNIPIANDMIRMRVFAHRQLMTWTQQWQKGRVRERATAAQAELELSRMRVIDYYRLTHTNGVCAGLKPPRTPRP
jgi:hypothetical protein